MGDNLDFEVSEDPAPTNDLGGGEEDAAQTAADPTATEEFDTSLEALQALFDAEENADDFTESAAIPPVVWAKDKDQPDFSHSHTAAAAGLELQDTFTFDARTFELLAKANHFNPQGKNGLIAFGLRGGKLIGSDTQEDVSSIQIEDTRPDHKHFQCTLGIFDTNTKKISAYTGSTVPNVKWMTNYYKKINGIQPHSKTRSNLMPTGCYIFRVNAHGGGKIKPALRMTDPDDLKADAVCTVLRTHNDLSYGHDDFWDRSKPYDNIHCAYSENSFSSAGCQTIKGANKSGAWGAFQKVIGALGWDARIDYMLLTGREAAIAAAILAEGRDGDAALVQATLERLRVGSEGAAVTALQKKLGFNGSGYFGPSTKKRLTEREATQGLKTDGVYSPADDVTTGWEVFPNHAPSPVSVADGSPGTTLDLADTPAGNAVSADDGRANVVVFQSEPGADTMSFQTDANLTIAGIDVPLAVKASVEGIPNKVGIEITVAAINRTGGSPSEMAPDPSDNVELSAETFDAFAPNARGDYRDAILEQGTAILGSHGITANARRLSHFMAQLTHESGGFAHRIESLNYTSAERIHKMWPRRVKSIAAAESLVRNERGLAEAVYGNRMGNDTPGDGFKYRGRGLIQLTGKTNYREYGERLDVDLVDNPDLAFEPVVALRIAAEYWARRKRRGERPMNALADDNKLRAITYRINGGFTNFAHREEELVKAKSIWSDDGPAITEKIVERGDFNDDVRHLQLSLVSLGLLGGTVDGKFGNGTYKSLFGFKSEAGLDGEGYADAATFAALDDPGFTEFAPTEGDGDIPVIGEDPEVIREGVSVFEEDVLG